MNPSEDPIKHQINALSAVDRRLTTAFGVVIAVLMLIVLLVGGLYMTRVMEREERQLATQLTQVLSSAVSRVSFSGKYHAQLLLNDIKQERPEIGYLRMTDRDGRVLASTEPSQRDQLLNGAALKQVQLALAEGGGDQTRRLKLDANPILEITLPYRGGFDHSIQGVVQVGISQQMRDAELRRGIILIASIVLVLLALGVLVVIWLSRRFGNPVKRLASDLSATLQAIPDLLFELDLDGRYLQVLAKKQSLL
ncbi:MAG: hypothetical protein HQL47_08415, partial [Gammaproteobacteria bacterium]|nr:hypothetical protein [Gammaproteobacteria bacterium]